MTQPTTADYQLVALVEIEVDPENPRDGRYGDLAGLAASMDEVGLLEPIVLRIDTADPEARYQLVAGERRYRAAAALEWEEIPAVVFHDLADLDHVVAQAVENVQRLDLDPIQEGHAYARLKDLGLTQTEIASRVGRSKAHVSKRLALLKLPPKIQTRVSAGDVAVEDGVSLSRLPAEELMVDAIEKRPAYQTIPDFVAEVHAREQVLRRIAVREKELETAGDPVYRPKTRDRYGRWDPYRSKAIGRVGIGSQADVKLDPKLHAAISISDESRASCHAVLVNPIGWGLAPDAELEAVPLCLDPERHRDGTSPLQDEQAKKRTADEKAKAAEEKRRDDRVARFAAVAAAMPEDLAKPGRAGRRLSAKVAGEIALGYVQTLRPNYQKLVDLLYVLGIPGPEETGGEWTDYEAARQALDEKIAAGGDEALRLVTIAQIYVTIDDGWGTLSPAEDELVARILASLAG